MIISGLYYKHCYDPRVVIYDSKVRFNLKRTLWSWILWC